MQVKCELCGGKNELLPGQKMLKCIYCGSALAVEDKEYEHLILPHSRDDGTAEDILCSFLLKRGCPAPDDIETEFSYVPFSVIEDESGGTSCIPADGAPRGVGPLADIPAGDYCFFDEKLTSGENLVQAAGRDDRACRMIHLPLYLISFRMGKQRLYAVITGENWHVQMEKVPARRNQSMDIASLIPAAGLFLIYLLAGKLTGSWLARLGLMAAAASVGYSAYRIRDKVTFL
ncbi:MAG TPA: hypothetical protein VKO43_08595 [Candidatus Krumholzibacteriaceae bacterium]|nr:hypothetical protein [Candidatus Krumholzibacteriaceae bacterium]